ncbi:Elongator complex protein 2 [Podosphaera aphanis]|nr:Elongator complex protein 2 [Podosphaera aphanis]
MLESRTEYMVAGANRHPSTADWDRSGLLAYGTNRNIALWKPQAQGKESRGPYDLLTGHTDTVNAVKFFSGRSRILLSGSSDNTLRVWKPNSETQRYSCSQILSNHTGSINCIAESDRCSKIFATGSADSTVKIWSCDEEDVVSLKQNIALTPKFFPLALSLTSLVGSSESHVLAVAGTINTIQLYVFDFEEPVAEFKLQATLSGHEGWIRSLEFTQDRCSLEGDILLCSASQDKYIRLWRIHQGKELPTVVQSNPLSQAFMPGVSLSNKAHRFKAHGLDFSATFEALLFGHEDWIYSAKWRPTERKLQLLSASADNSLAVWEADAKTGVFTIIARIGEISSEKGSTTATGSTGGFWTGLWSPSGETVICLGRTGSWRMWNWDINNGRWNQGLGISGHTQAVNGIAWSKKGEYLLSTGSDQTTRLHAKWKHLHESWHEMARPQIHGYDLFCIDSLGHSQFVSGAEEKLLRVFKQPKAVASLLQKLCGIETSAEDEMPEAANMPVLGLSNKTIEVVEDDLTDENLDSRPDTNVTDIKSKLNLNHPPLEDHLSKYTLWPEMEKLYGHGYEISALAANRDGSLIATACKASSIDHAVIRLYETKSWHEIKPSLVAHSLTVTSLKFSDDNLLLSTGRDRQFCVFQADATEKHIYKLVASNPKAHSRMILDAAWAPGDAHIFGTAGRDKQVKVWAEEEASSMTFLCKNTINDTHPVTAVSFLDTPGKDGRQCLAIGNEMGHIKLYYLEVKDFSSHEVVVQYKSLSPFPSRSITQLAWRPTCNGEKQRSELAIASEDCSIRIYSIAQPDF